MCFYLSDFFFSSRRRHTRYWRDWSSDVCSSDLPVMALGYVIVALIVLLMNITHIPALIVMIVKSAFGVQAMAGGAMGVAMRSEERRVGKECRSRWSPYH